METYAIGIMVVGAAALIVYSLWPKKGAEEGTIRRRMAGRSLKKDLPDARQQAKESVAKRVMETVAPIAVRPVLPTNSEEMSKLRMKLATAGFRSENVPTIFLASKTVVAILLGLAGVAYAVARGTEIQSAAGVILLGAGVGFMAPNLWLRMAISKRAELIRKGLPDTLDMLVISVESGLGLDAAFQRVGEEMLKVHPVLSEELQIVTIEAQMGIPRNEALGNFAARSGIEEAGSLVGVINQAERFGTSIAGALRRQSTALRIKRRQRAEEKAQQTTVKLMAPLILFIFPAILVVLAGPAGLKMMETLGNQ
ncbi:MAG: type II secretion system F family protein [Phycisphaerales bacterium]|nr:MAG: type II secretion system F family protein [Phycisphaerales bacterium]